MIETKSTQQPRPSESERAEAELIHDGPRPGGAPFIPISQRTLTPALPFCQLTLRGQRPRLAAYPRELNTLGDRARKRRLDLGLLQREVADRLGVDETTVNNWERGRTTPARRFTAKIAQFLDSVPMLKHEQRTIRRFVRWERRCFQRRLSSPSRRNSQNDLTPE